MKLSNLKVKFLENATGAGLEAAVNTYTAGLTESRYVRVHFGKPDAGNYWAFIEYVD